VEMLADYCRRNVQLEGLSVGTRSAGEQALCRGPRSVHPMTTRNSQ